MEASSVDARRVRAARAGVLVLFIGMGIMLGTHVSRVPSIRDALGLTPAGLAALFIIGSVGGLVAFALLGGLVARVGSLALVRLASGATIVGFWSMGYAAHLGTSLGFALALFVTLGAFETVNALANAEAATVERLVGRSIMSQFHAAFSLALLAGVGMGALYSHAGVAVGVHFAVNVTVIGAAFLAVAAVAIVDGRPPPADSVESKDGLFVTLKVAGREPRTLALGFILFCAFTVEMGAADWVPLAIVDDFARTEALAAALYAVLVVAQSVIRMMGAPLIDRLGRVTVLRTCAVLVAVGAVIFAFTPAFWGVPLALLVWGCGVSFGYPLAISAAGDDRTHATARVAAVAAFGTIAGLTMPQVIGLIAEHVELRKALLVTVVAAAAMYALAPAARPLEGAPGSLGQGAADRDREEVRDADTLGP
ncbi:MFS transporter [Demequina gelatinilytica]|uniref:MFS transporter n=1 Tax=Demequina gelatinilytica TaxID=1638980 RepID=UPI000781767D|nr:MFS transporter [Demequina gelatinilytica]